MSVFDNLQSIKFKIVEGEKAQVTDFWRKGVTRYQHERIYLINEGSAQMYLKGTTLTLRPGHLYFIPAYSVIKGHCPHYMDHYFVHFEFETMGNDFLSLFHLCNETDASDEDFAIFSELITLINKTPASPQRQLHQNGIMQILISKFLMQREFDNVNLDRINAAINYINENMHKHITVKSLANMLHISEIYFSGIFSKTVGISPIQYILNKKVHYATELLMNPTLSVKEVAFAVGFTDELYFSRIFKMKMGLTPSEFRKQTKAQNNKQAPPPEKESPA